MIEFTEEMVLNQEAMPKGCESLRYYRQEIFIPGEHFPIEMGGLWLPPHVDITEIEDLVNKSVDISG